MEKDKEKNLGIRQSITITDEHTIELLNKIIELGEYKSKTKAISDCLFYGVDVLYGKMIEEQELPQEKEPTIKELSSEEKDFYNRIIKLLKETTMILYMNKTMLSSMYRFLEAYLCGETLPAKKFSEGAYKDTPEYLVDFEMRAMRKL